MGVVDNIKLEEDVQVLSREILLELNKQAETDTNDDDDDSYFSKDTFTHGTKTKKKNFEIWLFTIAFAIAAFVFFGVYDGDIDNILAPEPETKVEKLWRQLDDRIRGYAQPRE
ncbi:MAG: hypothetical protein COC24_001020 [Alphaproteobacteria bacterium]|nr:hypothetical protein [Alphaproteobacteria bacterium]